MPCSACAGCAVHLRLWACSASIVAPCSGRWLSGRSRRAPAGGCTALRGLRCSEGRGAPPGGRGGPLLGRRRRSLRCSLPRFGAVHGRCSCQRPSGSRVNPCIPTLWGNLHAARARLLRRIALRGRLASTEPRGSALGRCRRCSDRRLRLNATAPGGLSGGSRVSQWGSQGHKYRLSPHACICHAPPRGAAAWNPASRMSTGSWQQGTLTACLWGQPGLQRGLPGGVRGARRPACCRVRVWALHSRACVRHQRPGRGLHAGVCHGAGPQVWCLAMLCTDVPSRPQSGAA